MTGRAPRSSRARVHAVRAGVQPVATAVQGWTDSPRTSRSLYGEAAAGGTTWQLMPPPKITFTFFTRKPHFSSVPETSSCSSQISALS